MRSFFVRIIAIVLLSLGGHASAGETESAQKKSDTFTVDFPDTSIREIIQSVAEIIKLRVEIPDSLQGTTSIKLRDVTWRQLYQVALQPVDHEFIEYDDRVVILTTKNAASLPWVEKEFELLFQLPAEAVVHLEKKMAFAKPILKARAQSIVIKIHPRYAKTVSEYITKIDQPDVRLFRYPRKPFFPDILPLPGEVLPTRKLEPAQQVTIDLGNGETATGELATTEIVAVHWVDCEELKKHVNREVPDLFKIGTDIRSNALVITGDKESLNRAQSVIEYLDDKRWYDPKTRERK